MKAPRDHLGTPSLRKLMRRLRKRVPLVAPVRLVQRTGVKCGDDWVLAIASTGRKNGRKKPHNFRIVVDSRLSRAEKWECVIHEYAHCLDRSTRRWSHDCHDARWGQCLARVFRASLP